MLRKKIADFISNHIQASITIAFGLTSLIGILFSYYFLPILLNYAPGSINTEFDKEFSGGLTYFVQFVLIFLAVFCIGNAWLSIETRDFKNIKKYLDDLESSKNPDIIKRIQQKLVNIKVKCITLPRKLFFFMAIFPSVGVLIVFAFLNFLTPADLKVVLIVAITTLLIASVGQLLLKSVLKSVLITLNNTELLKTTKFSLTTSLIMQFVPLMLICIIYTYLITYSVNMDDKSSILKEHYTFAVKDLISNSSATTLLELQNDLNKINFINENDEVFLITENNEFINFNNVEVTDFFIKYALNLAKDYDNVVYDYYGTEAQGILIPINFNGNEITVVIRYDLTSPSNAIVFLNICIVFVFGIISISYFSHSVVKEISIVTTNMLDIVKNKSDALQKKLPVTSNDEIGELIMAFNEIQDLTVDNLNEIEDKQHTLMEKERLASLGQLIGGIAHNMKTPIMSISGATEGLTELVGEYVASIDNPMVTHDDHKEIAKDMLDWVTKIKTHTSYMSDILTTVKGQASQLTTSEYDTFTVYDLSKRVDILIKHEIKKALLTLDINLNCDPSQIIHGDINNLIQVVNNLITNAIQAYNGKPNEHIILDISTLNNNILIKVSDNGCGMSKEVQSKLFKEMITTKGKNGTGLGLYMSYSTIKGKFNGNITFESEEGVGTTFIITIPKG